MPRRGAVRPGKGQSSFGTHLLDHLATHGTGLTGGQVTVIALLQVHADFLSGLHLKLVQGLAGAGHDRLIGIVGTCLLYTSDAADE